MKIQMMILPNELNISNSFLSIILIHLSQQYLGRNLSIKNTLIDVEHDHKSRIELEKMKIIAQSSPYVVLFAAVP